MALLKSVFIALLATVSIFFITIWIIPVASFIVIFGVIALVIYAIIQENNQIKGPPR